LHKLHLLVAFTNSFVIVFNELEQSLKIYTTILFNKRIRSW